MDVDDELDSDFGFDAAHFVGPEPYSPYAEVLRICDRIVALMDRIIEQNGQQK